MNELVVSKENEVYKFEEMHDFEKVLKHLYNTIFMFSKTKAGDCVFTLSEGGIAEKMGMTTESLQNKQIREVFSSDVAVRIEETCEQAFKGVKGHFEIQLDEFYFLVYLSPIIEKNEITEVIGTAIDITERRKAEDKIKEMAYQDSLTNLPNRRLLEKEGNQLIGHSETSSFGILFLDIDRFKNINDTFGHSFGDELLIMMADRIKTSLGTNGMIFRQGGDEFIILLPEKNRQQVSLIVETMVRSIEKKFMIEKEEVFASVSIGASMYPNDGDTVAALMKHADAAMYYAKSRGKEKFQFFSENLNMNLRKKFILEKDLRQAIDFNQLELVYQPQVNIHTGELIGMESLLRWNHPKLGYISPKEFIPIAEETELIIPIGNWVLETACKQHKHWQDKGFPLMTMSVNVSQLQFNQPGFIQSVKEILSKCRMSGGSLELEITESIMADFPRAERVLNLLNDLGVKISIDDFGTGYSSLSYLSRLPIHKLKIDQSFLTPLNKENKAIIKTIIGLAENLQLEVIAEGVETEEHVTFLIEQNIKQVQGYYFGKPQSAERIDSSNRTNNYSERMT